jgi:hypothetical protein
MRYYKPWSKLLITLSAGNPQPYQAPRIRRPLRLLLLAKKKKQKPPLFDARVAWTEPITPLAKEWAAHCEETLSHKSLDPKKMKPLEVILGILRNLSFVAANRRLLAYSCSIWHPIWMTGQKLLCDKLFLSVSKTLTDETTVTFPTPSLFGLAADGSWGFGGLWLAKQLDTKEDVVNDVSKELLLQLTHEHLASVWSIFPGLARILSNSSMP